MDLGFMDRVKEVLKKSKGKAEEKQEKDEILSRTDTPYGKKLINTVMASES
jgi:ABC-type oligopeptide transport system ATPase subunit